MYFVGRNNFNGGSGSSSVSGRGGVLTVQLMEGKSFVQVVGRTGKKYGVWLNSAANSWIGEKMFIRYAVKVCITDEKVHVWIKRMGGGRPVRKTGYSTASYRGPMYSGGRRTYSRYQKRSSMKYGY
jgi:hypothetical protein